MPLGAGGTSGLLCVAWTFKDLSNLANRLFSGIQLNFVQILPHVKGAGSDVPHVAWLWRAQAPSPGTARAATIAGSGPLVSRDCLG